MYQPGPSNWVTVISNWIELLSSFVEGNTTAREYRDRARDPAFTSGVWGDSPFYPAISQLRHDANEFNPCDESRDEDDMSPEELRVRASFALDLLKVTLAYYQHIAQK